MRISRRWEWRAATAALALLGLGVFFYLSRDHAPGDAPTGSSDARPPASPHRARPFRPIEPAANDAADADDHGAADAPADASELLAAAHRAGMGEWTERAMQRLLACPRRGAGVPLPVDVELTFTHEPAASDAVSLRFLVSAVSVPDAAQGGAQGAAQACANRLLGTVLDIRGRDLPGADAVTTYRQVLRLPLPQ